jgi:hypothetical protein
MAHPSRDTRQRAHELIDHMAPGQVSAVVSLIEIMLDPISRAIANAPYDEPVTAEEEKSLTEAREWSKHNKGILHEQVLAELGITQEEIDHFQEPMSNRSSVPISPSPMSAAWVSPPPFTFSPRCTVLRNRARET